MSIITYEVRAYSSGSKYWYLNDELHREDGPAIELPDGSKEWWLNGQRHREDGPAIEDISGYKAWYLKGMLHREDGPAYEDADGYKAWYLNGVGYTKEEFNKKVLTTVEMTMSEIEELVGKKVKVVK